MNALFNQFIINLTARLTASIPAKKFLVDWNCGQLNVPPDVRPSVPHRSILVDIDASYETKQPSAGNRVQWANCNITLSLVFSKHTNTSNLTPSPQRENGMDYFEDENDIYLALQDWDGGNLFRLIPMKRMSVVTSKDAPIGIRNRNMVFFAKYEDSQV
jgi:hypothetical protein